MATELTKEAVMKFIIDNGGKVKNQKLVTHFRQFINDPKHRDEARQNFKEYVNLVAMVKTENGEKYVQLKKKYRVVLQQAQDTGQSAQSPDNQEQAISKTLENQEPPINKDRVHKPGPKVETSHEPPPSTVQNIEKSSAKQNKDKQQRASVPKHSTPHKIKPSSQIATEKISISPFTDKNTEGKSFTPKKMESLEFADGTESTATFKKPGTPPSMAKKSNKTAAIQQQLQEQQQKTVEKPQKQVSKLPPRSAPTSQNRDNVTRPAPSPTSRKRDLSRIQKGRKEISGPTDLVPTGAVERARQNFQGKKGGPDDATSIAPSEKSVDSKEADQYEDDDRAPPSFIMDATDKQWMFRSAQCDMVELRKMLNADPTLAEKRDFFLGYTALHWAVKRGNVDLVRMFCDHGVDVNARTNGGYTPLHLAAQHGHDKVLQILIEEFECNTNLRDYSGRLARDYVRPGSLSLPIQTILFGNGNGSIKAFAHGLRPRLDVARKSWRIGSKISGGVGRLNSIVNRKSQSSQEDLSGQSPNMARKGSFRSRSNTKKKNRKWSNKDEMRPSITLVTHDDSGFSSTSNSSSMSSLAPPSSGGNLRKPSSDPAFSK